MDKRLIRPLEGWMAIPEIVKVLNLSRARVHQLIDEDKFDVDDMRVVGDKRMVVIKNAAVYAQLRSQEERAERLRADKEAEEQRILSRFTKPKLHTLSHNVSDISLSDAHIPEPTCAEDLIDLEELAQ